MASTYTELTATDRADWLRLRHGGIGASEIAAVMGRSPWDSPFNLHWKKRGDVPEELENEYTNWGHRLEPVIVDHFAERHPEFAVCTGIGVCVNDDRNWQRCTPDGLLYEHSADPYVYLAGLEVKNAHDRREWDGDEFQGIPQHYYDQVQWSMDVTGLPVWWVAVLFGGNTYAEYEVAYDEPYARELRDAGEAFWNDVLAERAPDLDAHLATKQRLIRLHDSIDDTEVEIDHELAGTYVDACMNAKWAEDLKREAENRIRDAIGDGRYAVVEGHRIATRSIAETTRIDSKRLKAERPDVVAEFSSTSVVHRLIPARRKGA